jgi:hypothetical protein
LAKSRRAKVRDRIFANLVANNLDTPGTLHPWPGGWPLPAAGGRHSLAETPDQTCFLQSIQKAKQSRQLDPLCFGL